MVAGPVVADFAVLALFVEVSTGVDSVTAGSGRGGRRARKTASIAHATRRTVLVRSPQIAIRPSGVR